MNYKLESTNNIMISASKEENKGMISTMECKKLN